MSLEIKFCPNCINILNITKNPPKKKQVALSAPDLETPNTVSGSESDSEDDNLSQTSKNSSDSDSENENDNNEDNKEQKEIADNLAKVEKIIGKLEKGESVPDTDFGEFRLEQFTKHKAYMKLDKKIKPTVQAKLISYYEKVDDATSAYYACDICSYSKAIEPGTLISSRMSTGVTNTYMNFDKLKNRAHNKMLGYTRNYICVNKNCVSHGDHSKREAVIYRVGNSIQAWYTCRAPNCQAYWKGE